MLARPVAVKLLQQQRRNITGPVGPAHALAATAGYPEGSMSSRLLERCMDAAVAAGIDVTAEYKPYLPVDLMQTLLVDVHDAVGCSWLMAIVFACLGIRVMTLPVSVASIRAGREKALIQPQWTELVEKQKALTLEGDQEKLQGVSKKLQEFTAKHGKFFMFKGMSNLVLFQMPLYITAFAAMRGFAGHPHLFTGFAMESPLWLDSLALPDPYAVFPLLTASIMLTNTELFGSIDSEVSTVEMQQSAAALSPVSGMQKYQKPMMRVAALAFIPMTWNFPAGVFVFMSTNMVASTLQNRLLRLPALERVLEIPPRPEVAKEAAKALESTGALAIVAMGKTLQPVASRDLGRATKGANLSQTSIVNLADNAVKPEVGIGQAMLDARTPVPQSRSHSLRRVRPATQAEMLS